MAAVKVTVVVARVGVARAGVGRGVGGKGVDERAATAVTHVVIAAFAASAVKGRGQGPLPHPSLEQSHPWSVSHMTANERRTVSLVKRS